MWGFALITVLLLAVVAALAAAAIGGLLFALAASIAGALTGAWLHWSEPAIYAAQMTGPGLLLLTLLASSLVDRIARRRERFHLRGRRPADWSL